MKSMWDDLVVQNVLARDKTGKAMCQIDGENGGIGFWPEAISDGMPMVMCSRTPQSSES